MPFTHLIGGNRKRNPLNGNIDVFSAARQALKRIHAVLIILADSISVVELFHSVVIFGRSWWRREWRNPTYFRNMRIVRRVLQKQGAKVRNEDSSTGFIN
jgi:hypothetical protein